MASNKKQKGMVFHQEGPTSPVAVPAVDHPPACFIVPKPGKVSKGRMEQTTRVTNEGDMMGKPSMYPSKDAFRTSVGLSAVKYHTSSNPQPDNLPPDRMCKGIRVTLDNNSMWNDFFRCKTEMILTKQGSRMFPYCRFRISGLQPSRKYSLLMDIQPSDSNRYKWTGKSWQIAGKAECHVKSQPFTHPESSSTGQHWMQNPVSFYKLKLTNNISDQEGNTILQPMHRYLPRLYVVQTDKAAKDVNLNDSSVVSFTFPQTEFMAVTAYQNVRFSQLKVKYNPFAKGLKEGGSSSLSQKLKLNSGKESNKDGETATNEQNPVKKNLKSLLATHKPRSSKTVDSKPSVSGDLQKNSTPNKDQSSATIPGECLSNSSRPAQKLFSELIREAHVSLQRCNMEQLDMNNSISNRAAQINTKTTTLKSNTQHAPKRDSVSVRACSETSLAKKGETVATKRKINENKDLLNSSNSNPRTESSEVSNVVAAPAVLQNSPVDPEGKLEATMEMKEKQHKRPVPLPLPALALFLRQHSTKSKKAKSKPDSPPPALPSESLSESQCSPSDQTSSTTFPSKDLSGDITNCDREASGHASALHLDEDVSRQAVETAHKPSSPSCQDAVTTDSKEPTTADILGSDSVAESTGPDQAVPDGTPVLGNSIEPFCALGTSVSTISSTLATSSTSPILSPPLDTVLHDPTLPQSPTITRITLPSDSPTMKSDSSLPDPECSSFGFESLSPASSPEPLPSLPTSLTLLLDSANSESTPKAVPLEELAHSEDSVASVFKWHTVLPPPEPYTDTSFTTFQSTAQTLPLASVTSPLMPSQSPCHPEPQTLNNSTSTPPPDPAPSFQENEQSLPFPAELSPLALQLPLSPTFSSLDGEALSPTPSLADLVHFLSTNDDLGMGTDDFSPTETEAVPCPPPSTAEANAHEPSQRAQPPPAHKPCKRKKKSGRRKLAKTDKDQMIDDSNYTSMQPNLEEVEEQLFISFTSKEALKLHIVDSSEEQLQTTPEGHLEQTVDARENVKTAEGLEEKIAAFENILLRDLKLMKHKQAIHPVLQEVGLKMNLLDPTLAIDLQYLGVHLPIPPPGVSVEPLTQEPPPSQGVCGAFVSRTGKTKDVTQIKGWRDKFSQSEAPPTLITARPEAGPSSDLPKKNNLSAFCSDMLDEYLENEGKLIDERAASFSQPQVEPLVYELPTKSTSYVRTLDSILKKQTIGSPTSELISGFIPPSKRPKLSLRETKIPKREKLRGPKRNKPRAEPAAASVPVLSTADSNLVLNRPAIQNPANIPQSEDTASTSEPQRSKKKCLKAQLDSAQPLAFKKRRRFKPKTLSQTLTPPSFMTPTPGVSEEMAPLESDSELVPSIGQGDEASRKNSRPVMTRSLLRQKDLENEVVWEGQHRTSITVERATIALTSLFTLKGFVSENPTAPVQLIRTRAPPCLNEYCRLGCICSSVSHCSRISHCGRPACMFGCSCLKQKVVLLKNLDGSDSSPSHHGNNRKRKRRMKMAYILKEADCVSQPAERVRTLWKRNSENLDPDPVHVPEPTSLPSSAVIEEGTSSCARVRGFQRKKQNQIQKDPSKTVKPKRLKSLKRRDLTLKDSKTSSPPPAGQPVHLSPSDRPPSPPAEPVPKPSKRLIIMAECKWANPAEQDLVLRRLCEKMAWDQLDKPFWMKNYLINPISQTVEESDTGRCIQYKVHISTPRLEGEKTAAPEKPQENQTEMKQQQDHLKQVKEEEEAEPLEDWQREVEEGDIKEEAGSAVHQLHDERESSRHEMKKRPRKRRKMNVRLGLPFLTGICPAGFLTASRKQPGGTDHLVQVNGKMYPLAKIQLGKMGALHPANRLAAYLTGRVGSSRKQQGVSSSSSPSNPPQNQTSGVSPQTVSSGLSEVSGFLANPPARPQPSVTVLTLPTPPTVIQPAAVKVQQSAGLPASAAAKGTVSQLVTVRLYPGPQAKVKVVPGAPDSPTSITDSQVSSSVVPTGHPAPKGPQVLMFPAPGPHGKAPSRHPPTCPLPTTRTGQQMVLQPVQTASGGQYYRRPDGKLVQLVAINQLRPGRPNMSGQSGSSSPSVLPAASQQTPVVTVMNQTRLLTTVKASSSSSTSTASSSTSLSSHPAPSFLSQKGTCTFKILRSNSNKDPIVVTCTKLPPKPPTKVATSSGSFTLLQPHPPSAPVNLISLKPSTGQGAELGVKTVAMSAFPAHPAGVVVHQKPTSPQTNNTTIQTPAETTHRPPSPPSALPEVSPVHTPPPKPPPDIVTQELKPSCDLMDLDIICVDDEGLVSMEMVGKAKEVSDMVDRMLSSETENSSDLGDDSQEEEAKSISNHRHNHNKLEKQRRGRIQQLLQGLRREVGLSEKTSKISTLRKAVQLIQQLRTTETDLKDKKKRLLKRRDDFLTIIAPTADNCRSHQSDLTERQQIESEVANTVADLLDELTENSSDEDRVITKKTNAITDVQSAKHNAQSVAMETVEESDQLSAAHGKMIRRNINSGSEKTLNSAQSITAAFKALSSVMRNKNSSKRLLLKQAHQEIQTLQREMQRLKSVKICLNQQRDAYIREISHRSGKSEHIILRKLQHLSYKQRMMEQQERRQEANHLSAAAGGGASEPAAGNTTNDDIIVTFSDLQQQAPQAPPTSVSPTPTTPVQTLVPMPVQTPVHQPQTNSQGFLQVLKPVLPPPGVLLGRDRPRTIPNILSRCKNRPPPSSTKTAEESPPFQALVPAEVLSLVGVALPGKQVLTLSPLMVGSTVLQAPPTPGVASVTLNIPNLTSQQIQLSSAPQPPTAKNLNNLLQLVQPSAAQPHPQPPEQQQVPAGHSLSPPPVVSARSDQIQDQEEPLSQTDTPPEHPLSPPPPSAQGLLSSRCPAPGAGHQVEFTVEGPLGSEQEMRQDADNESLTSLLNEIDFLNQQNVATATTEDCPLPGKLSSDMGQQEDYSPWVLQLDSDSDDTSAIDMADAGFNDHSGRQSGSSKKNTLAPPPLLQMKVGGVKVADPSNSDEGTGGKGGGGRKEEAVAWRPMPRLVPLGLRGNPPS